MLPDSNGESAVSKAEARGPLSEREQEILKLVATGASNKLIAQQLQISQNTVKVHLRNIFDKIGVASRTEAALYAVRAELTHEPPAVTPIRDVEPPQTEPKTAIETAEPPPPLEAAPSVVVKAPRARSIWPHPAVWLAIALAVVIIGLGLQTFLARRPVESTPPAPATAVARWLVNSNLPVARAGLASAAYDNQIFVIGGDTPNGVTSNTMRYDIVAKAWTRLADKPVAVADISAAVIGGLIYVPGGRLDSGVITSTLEVFDPQANQWSRRAPIPSVLSGYAMVALEGELYLFGGWDGQHYVDTVYVYDPQLDKWSEDAPLPSARGFATAATASDRIYVIGGTDGSTALADNLEFSPNSRARGGPSWQNRAPLPVARARVASATVADIIFVIGGEGVSGQWLTLEYTALNDSWQQIELPQVHSWSRLAAVASGTSIYALGGSVDGALVVDNFSYQALYTITLPAVH